METSRHQGATVVRTLVPEVAVEAVPVVAINDDTPWPWPMPRRLLSSHSRSELHPDSSSPLPVLRHLTSRRKRTNPSLSPASTSPQPRELHVEAAADTAAARAWPSTDAAVCAAALSILALIVAVNSSAVALATLVRDPETMKATGATKAKARINPPTLPKTRGSSPATDPAAQSTSPSQLWEAFSSIPAKLRSFRLLVR